MDMFRQSSKHSVQFHRTPNSSTALNSECIRTVPRVAFWGGVTRVTRWIDAPGAPGPALEAPELLRELQLALRTLGRGKEAKKHFSSESSGDPFAERTVDFDNIRDDFRWLGAGGKTDQPFIASFPYYGDSNEHFNWVHESGCI